MTQTIAQQLNIKDFPFVIKDKTGNQIYWENSDGYWHKSEYNPNTQTIKFENSNGYWSKREYDSRGFEIYFEDSDGLWFKREYDDKGKEIYFENSNGYIEDNRPKSSCENKIVEIDGKKYKLTKL